MVVRFPAYVFATFGVRGDGAYGERRQRRGWSRKNKKERKNNYYNLFLISFLWIAELFTGQSNPK